MHLQNVLMVAYEFPPVLDAGAFRPAAFAKYLPSFGYRPIVLTRATTGGRPVDYGQLEEFPEEVRIEKIQSRHPDEWNAHIGSRFKWLSLVDRVMNRPTGWASAALAWRIYRFRPEWHLKYTWTQPAVRSGLQASQRFQPDAVFATAPPFQSFEVGYELSRRLSVPLIIDFRDPFMYGSIWEGLSARLRRRVSALEAKFINYAASVTVVTPTMHSMMQECYPQAKMKIHTITNGFDDYPTQPDAIARKKGKMVIRHIGTITEHRWPAALLRSLDLIRRDKPDVIREFSIEFIGAATCAIQPILDEIKKNGFEDTVSFSTHVPYRESQSLMCESDALLLIQLTDHHVLTGKLFEYLHAKRPVIAVVPDESDAAKLIRDGSAGLIVGTDDPARMAEGLVRLYQDWQDRASSFRAEDSWLQQFHRRETTAKLAELLDQVSSADRRHLSLCSNK